MSIFIKLYFQIYGRYAIDISIFATTEDTKIIYRKSDIKYIDLEVYTNID